MEDKLKTLKDLSRVQRNDNYRIVEEETLKQEAIKHVKSFKDAERYEYVCDWINNFFNITEEDLK